MSVTVTKQEAADHFEELLARVIGGESEVIIAEEGTPVARLLPANHAANGKPRVPGSAAGQFVVPDDFNAPLPDDLESSFYK